MPLVDSKTAALWLHDNITPLRFAVIYVAFMVVLLGATLPTITVVKQNSRQNHRDQAKTIATSMAGHFDQTISKMFAAMEILNGFVASAAPLQAPDYFQSNATERAEVALRTATPGALSFEAFLRVYTLAAKKVDGFSNAYVRPGLINVFSTTATGINVSGIDLLFHGPEQAETEFNYMVNTTKQVIRGPLPPTADNVISLVIRSPVFTQYNHLSTNPADVDVRTGRHVNWPFLWGSVTITMDVSAFTRSRGLKATVPDDYDYMFESFPNNDRILPTQYIIVANTTPTQAYSDAVASCAETSQFTNFCFRLKPRNGWHGGDLAVSLATTALLEIFIPLIVLGLAYGAARLLLGPRPDALIDAPRRIPFHAVCIDMAGANKMWGEVPFVMSEVTRIFTAHLQLEATKHRVHIATRLGNTVVVISAHRSRVINFTQAMNAWAVSYEWPAHVLMHARNRAIVFTSMMHTCEHATLWVDPSKTQCEAGGPDIQLLLLLRSAAVPGYVMCTHTFLGIHDMNDQMDRAASSKDSTQISTVRSVLDIVSALHEVREIGTCTLPMPNVNVTPVRGFLMASAATGGQKLSVVVDKFPRWVWDEWMNPRALMAAAASITQQQQQRPQQQTAPATHLNLQFSPLGESTSVGIESQTHRREHRNPLSATAHIPIQDSNINSDDDLPHSIDPSVIRSHAGDYATMASLSRSKTASIASSLRNLTDRHVDNGEADFDLPGSAVDLGDARRLASLLTAVAVSACARSSGGSQRAGPELFGREITTLRQLTSLATYYFVAYRVVLSPVEGPARDAMARTIAKAAGVPVDQFNAALAARCVRCTQEYLNFQHPHG
jgi:hypothetical protein